MKRAASLFLSALLTLMLLPVTALGTETSPYTVDLYMTEGDHYVTEESTVRIGVHIDGAQKSPYNAYYFTLSYDQSALEFTGDVKFSSSKTGTSDTDKYQTIASASNGVLTLAGFGDARNDLYIMPSFKVLRAGATRVTLQKAFVEQRDNKYNAAAPAPIKEDTRSVTIYGGGCTVTLPDECTGPAYAAVGGSYTFSAPAGYDYTFTAKDEHGNALTVTKNSDGTYTVEKVTEAFTVECTGTTPQTYKVSVSGSGAGDVTLSDDTSTHGTNYTFTLNKSSTYNYAVSVTVGGRLVTPKVENNTYTIPGADIIGDIVITVTKAAGAQTTQISFVGDGADETGNSGVYTVPNGEDYSFTLKGDGSYDYTVSIQNSDGTAIDPTVSGSTYTIPGEKINGGIITVTILRVLPPAVDVKATEFLKNAKGGAVLLITANPREALSAAQGLYYNKQPMPWSQEYGAYVWLVRSSGSTADAVAAAQNRITVGTAAHTTVLHTGDANGSGSTEINDAQLIYEWYMGTDTPDISDLARILRLLNADVNCDGLLDAIDARAVVFRINAG